VLIYLLRHGLTIYNKEKRYQGITDIPLSSEGIQQLCQADFSPDVVYISPLCRTRQTAEILFPRAKLLPINDFCEMDFGIFEGKNYREMEHDLEYRAWIDGKCESPCPGGESKQEFCERTCQAFESALEQAFQKGSDTVVLLAHGGTQMAIMERYGMPKREYYQWCGPNAGGYVTQTTEDQWRKYHTLRLLFTVQYTKDDAL
jgi:alpha-ribazole phosphatase